MTAHGTLSRYTNIYDPCRCADCRAAMRDYMRERRARQARLPIPDTVTHGASCYINWRCRCSICRAGQRAKHRSYRGSGQDSRAQEE